MAEIWFPASWKDKDIAQVPVYADDELFISVLNQLWLQPPLIPVAEIQALQQDLLAASQGKAFILQIGDCAESFKEASSSITHKKVEFIQSIAQQLTATLKKPVISIGRLAGQYAKPRTELDEVVDDKKILAYRGDMINDKELNEIKRLPDPRRLLQAYHCSAQILAELQMTKLNSSLYVSHEALHLPYEQALTRRSTDRNWYNQSTHLPWIGMRTAYLESAHVEYARGIANPIGIKVGASLSVDELLRIMILLNPENIPGKICLIHRFGAEQIENHLPMLLNRVQAEGLQAVWICDPMHGNTEKRATGEKIRRYDVIAREVLLASEIYQSSRTVLSGLHLEATYQLVQECIDQEEDCLKKTSLLDPRLNGHQTKRLIAEFLSLEATFRKK